MSTAISNRMPAVTLEYDTAKGRTTKHFTDANEAKRLFQPFRKSARDAALSGARHWVGTGFSRRLARQLDGELATRQQAAARRMLRAEPARR